MIEGNPVVLFVEGAKNSGCNFYRVRQPYQKITEKDLLPCAISSELSPQDLETWISKADVIWTQNHSRKFVEYVLEEKSPSQKIIFDYDDNIFAVSPFNPSYEKHGIREVDIEADGVKVEIRDGKNGFNLKENRMRLMDFVTMLEKADMIVCPSPVLAGQFKMHNRNVKILKNMLDMRIWSRVRIERDGWTRIGYQGGWSHFLDFIEVRDALEKVMTRNRNVRLVIMGQHYGGHLKNLPADRVDVVGWETMDAYPWRFKCLGVDVGIAPLHNDVFSTCKSEIKWEEYGALGIPCVASNIPPYNLAIDHEKTGLLAGTSGEWEEYLEKLVNSTSIRENIGTAAREKIMEEYDVDKHLDQHVDLVKSLFRKELILC